MGKFRATKTYRGYSSTFRQYGADKTHCRFLHSYVTSFQVIYEGELDDRNWIVDFGSFKRSTYMIDGMNPKDWLDYILDHTVIVAGSDPELEWFKEAERRGILQLRVLPDGVGCELFAKYLFEKINEWVLKETNGRARVTSVEFMEHDQNSAYFVE